MKVGKITAKLRDAVPVCFMVEGDEIIRFKNIEMPEALKDLEMRDFGFSIQGDGRIDFNIYFDQGILPDSFPAKCERKHRTPKLDAMAAMPEAGEAEGTPQPVVDAEPGQEPPTELMDEAAMYATTEPEAAQEAASGPEVTAEPEAEQVGMYRRMLARILNPQLSATLTYSVGGFVREIGCRSINAPGVTKGPRDIYSKFVVQLTCQNPFWREHTEHRSDIAAWVSSFEFPVTIPKLELNGAGGMELGYRMPSLIVSVYNGGDVETGLRVLFSALEAVKNPSIVNLTTGERIQINLSMVGGDELTVSTGYGDKWAVLIYAGKQSDALRYVDIDSTFIQLPPGENLIRYDAEEGLNNLEVSIFHSNLYLGV